MTVQEALYTHPFFSGFLDRKSIHYAAAAAVNRDYPDINHLEIRVLTYVWIS